MSNISIRFPSEAVRKPSVFPEPVYSFVCQPPGTNLEASWVISFIFGIIFAPLSWGLWWLLLYNIVWWIVDYTISRTRDGCWHFAGRAGIFIASIVGFVVGRLIYRGTKYPNNVLPRGNLPFMRETPPEHDF